MAPLISAKKEQIKSSMNVFVGSENGSWNVC
jgi:hypothetical protein